MALSICKVFLLSNLYVQKEWIDVGLEHEKVKQWGAYNLFIANFFAIKIIGGAKELVVLLRLSGNI
jgi:hypothetical protein